MDGIDHLAPEQGSAGKPWVLVVMEMLIDAHRTVADKARPTVCCPTQRVIEKELDEEPKLLFCFSNEEIVLWQQNVNPQEGFMFGRVFKVFSESSVVLVLMFNLPANQSLFCEIRRFESRESDLKSFYWGAPVETTRSVELSSGC